MDTTGPQAFHATLTWTPDSLSTPVSNIWSSRYCPGKATICQPCHGKVRQLNIIPSTASSAGVFLSASRHNLALSSQASIFCLPQQGLQYCSFRQGVNNLLPWKGSQPGAQVNNLLRVWQSPYQFCPLQLSATSCLGLSKALKFCSLWQGVNNLQQARQGSQILLTLARRQQPATGLARLSNFARSSKAPTTCLRLSKALKHCSSLFSITTCHS